MSFHWISIARWYDGARLAATGPFVIAGGFILMDLFIYISPKRVARARYQAPARWSVTEKEYSVERRAEAFNPSMNCRKYNFTLHIYLSINVFISTLVCWLEFHFSLWETIGAAVTTVFWIHADNRSVTWQWQSVQREREEIKHLSVHYRRKLHLTWPGMKQSNCRHWSSCCQTLTILWIWMFSVPRTNLCCEILERSHRNHET